MRLAIVVVGAALGACNSGGMNSGGDGGASDGTTVDFPDARIDGSIDAGGPTSGVGGPPLGTCSAGLVDNDWCWVLPRPQGDTITGVWASSPTDVWFSTYSKLVHLDGTGWTEVPGPSIVKFIGSTSNDIWGVGVNGEGVYHWDGTTWSGATGAAGGTQELVEFSATDVWSVNRDTANHWDGATWTPHVGPSFTPIAIGGDANNLIAVSNTGTIAKLIGTVWGVADATSHPGKDGVVIDPTHIVVIDDHAVMFWNNGTWTDAGAPVLGAPWVQVTAISLTDVWIAAPGARYHWNGTSWTLAAEAVSSYGFTLWQAPNGDVYTGDLDAQVKRWTGTSWVSLTDGPGRPSAVFGTSNTDIWAIGSYGYNAIQFVQHWNGTAWSEVPLTGLVVHSVNAVWGTGPSDMWVGAGDYQGSDVEQRQMLHWNGTAWTQYKLGTEDAAAVSSGFRLIRGFSATDIFAASTFKLYHWDGTSWSPVAVPLAFSFSQINDVYGTSSSDYYVASGNNLLHWDGTSWTTKTAPISVNSVIAVSPTNIWIQGPNQTMTGMNDLVHYDGAFFVPVSTTSCSGMFANGMILRDTDFYTCEGAVIKRSTTFGGTATPYAAGRPLRNAWLSPDGHLYVPGMEMHAP